MGKPKTYSIQRAPVYDMPPPNAGLPFRGGLRDLCRDDAAPDAARRTPPWAFAAEGCDTWLDPCALEDALDQDPALQQVLAALVADLERGKGGERRMVASFARVEHHVDRVFARTLLPGIAARFAAVKHLVLQYALAKAAARQTHPGQFPATTESAT